MAYTESQIRLAIDKVSLQQASLQSAVASLSARLDTFSLGVAAAVSAAQNTEQPASVLLKKQLDMRTKLEAEVGKLESVKDQLATRVEMMKSGGNLSNPVPINSAIATLQTTAAKYLDTITAHSYLMRTAGSEILGALDLLLAAVVPSEADIQAIVDSHSSSA